MKVFAWSVLPFLVEANGQLIPAALWPAHQLRKPVKISVVGSGHEASQRGASLRWTDAPALAVDCHGRTAQLLKLPDTPQAGPGPNALGASLGILFVQFQMFAVDILRDVLGHVADRRAPRVIDRDAAKSMLFRTRFIRVLPKCVLSQDAFQDLLMLRRQE